MAIDSRDQLWNAAFETYYDAFFQEMLSEKLIARWQRVDQLTRVLAALTASSSAVSGWALWTQPQFKTAWTIIAGFAAALTIIHATLGVPERVRDQGEIKRRWAAVRTDLETFRYRMKIDPNFQVDTFTNEFSGYRKRYADSIQLLKDDILTTKRTLEMVQGNLNRTLADEIELKGEALS